jgi:hypothetical protein
MFRNANQVFLVPLLMMDLKPPHLVIALRNANKERGQETLGAGSGGTEMARLRLGILKIGGRISINRERQNERQTVC